MDVAKEMTLRPLDVGREDKEGLRKELVEDMERVGFVCLTNIPGYDEEVKYFFNFFLNFFIFYFYFILFYFSFLFFSFLFFSFLFFPSLPFPSLPFPFLNLFFSSEIPLCL